MTLAQVAEREALYRLIDQLPDRQTPLVVDFVRRLLDVDDEPLTPDELRQLKPPTPRSTRTSSVPWKRLSAD